MLEEGKSYIFVFIFLLLFSQLEHNNEKSYLKVNMAGKTIVTTSNGESTLFWKDKWGTGSTLEEDFPRLYRLERDVGVSIAGKGLWQDNT